MITTKDFDEMRKEIEMYDSERELLIKKSRDVIKLSKRVIYSVHRDELKEAKSAAAEMQKAVSELDKYIANHAKLYYEGSYKESMQEYVEALLYFNFIEKKKILTRKELGVDTNYYLLGLCDLTGELVRRAINSATKSDNKTALVIKEVVDLIYGELIKFDFRNSDVRRKYDAVKYDLQKLENLCFEIRGKKK